MLMLRRMMKSEWKNQEVIIQRMIMYAIQRDLDYVLVNRLAHRFPLTATATSKTLLDSCGGLAHDMEHLEHLELASSTQDGVPALCKILVLIALFCQLPERTEVYRIPKHVALSQ
jgi:hypothetical protein